jgi:hypothetical protein
MFEIFNSTPKRQELVNDYIQRNLSEFLNPIKECSSNIIIVSIQQVIIYFIY